MGNKPSLTCQIHCETDYFRRSSFMVQAHRNLVFLP
jgi:hypothetical protein